MTRSITTSAAMVLAAIALSGPAVAKAPAPIAAALADAARPPADKDRDVARKPAELLAFAQVKPGQKVADFIIGGGYWTRILARTVGPQGKVYAYQPAEFIAYRAAYGTEQEAAVAPYSNVVAKRESLRAVAFAEPLDAILTVQNWHDLHLKQGTPGAAALIAKALYAALKPGGVLVVVDHVGAPGTADTLHRGDPAGTRAEIEAAGFRFDGQSNLYANPADPHDALVFTMRGKTDQFAYRFRKPR